MLKTEVTYTILRTEIISITYVTYNVKNSGHLKCQRQVTHTMSKSEVTCNVKDIGKL